MVAKSSAVGDSLPHSRAAPWTPSFLEAAELEQQRQRQRLAAEASDLEHHGQRNRLHGALESAYAAPWNSSTAAATGSPCEAAPCRAAPCSHLTPASTASTVLARDPMSPRSAPSDDTATLETASRPCSVGPAVADFVHQELFHLERKLGMKIAQSHVGITAKLHHAHTAQEAVVGELGHQLCSCSESYDRLSREVANLSARVEGIAEQVQPTTQQFAGMRQGSPQRQAEQLAQGILSAEIRLADEPLLAASSPVSDAAPPSEACRPATAALAPQEACAIDASLLLSLDQTIGDFAASLDAITDRVNSHDACIVDLHASVVELERTCSDLASRPEFRVPAFGDGKSSWCVEEPHMKQRHHAEDSGRTCLFVDMVRKGLDDDRTRHRGRPDKVGTRAETRLPAKPAFGSPTGPLGTSSEEPDEEDSLRAFDSPPGKSAPATVSRGEDAEGRSVAQDESVKLILGEFT